MLLRFSLTSHLSLWQWALNALLSTTDEFAVQTYKPPPLLSRVDSTSVDWLKDVINEQISTVFAPGQYSTGRKVSVSTSKVDIASFLCCLNFCNWENMSIQTRLAWIDGNFLEMVWGVKKILSAKYAPSKSYFGVAPSRKRKGLRYQSLFFS